METTASIGKVAFVGDYLPRKCGIATFTTDLCRAVATQFPGTRSSAVSVNDIESGYAYGPEVQFEIAEQDLSAYLRAADFLNIDAVDVVCVQHEFGVYGGPAGSHLLALLRELTAPVVTTLHTVLRQPDAAQERVMRELIGLSSRLVVMTRFTEQLLRERYQAPAAKIDLIAHGIPDMPFVDPEFYKDLFGVEGKQVLLTFGLLSPGKGVEHVLRALPEVVRQRPEVVYIVLGATHPHLVREQGEAYRISLERLAKDLGVDRHVIFYNRFVELQELTEFIAAADVYVTPYLNEAQAVSGTLAYAFGCGKAVISTPYWHARELLAEGAGILVPFGDSSAITRAVLDLLLDDSRRHSMRKRAYLAGRDMIWSQVAQQYLQSFEKARSDRARSRRAAFATRTLDRLPGHLPELKLDHLSCMTDSTGVFQHALFTVPNFSEGYCTDDNARALLLTVLLEELGWPRERLRPLRSSYFAFLCHALHDEKGRFRNFLSFDRRWLEDTGSEDSHGRALWALGACVGRFPDSTYQSLAGRLFARALPPLAEFTSPRAWAFALLGFSEYLSRLSGDRQVAQLQETLAERLLAGLATCRQDGWVWFEDHLCYDNPRLAQALIATGAQTGREDMLGAGLATLTWLMDLQTVRRPLGDAAEARHLRPVGSHSVYRRGGERPIFDQQPVEAWASVSACLEAFRATSEVSWYDQALRAFEWFLGRNDVGLAVYDPTTGGCRDGLHPDRTNENQGAESTLAFLLALAELQLMQNVMTTFKTPELALAGRSTNHKQGHS